MFLFVARFFWLQNCLNVCFLSKYFKKNNIRKDIYLENRIFFYLLKPVKIHVNKLKLYLKIYRRMKMVKV